MSLNLYVGPDTQPDKYRLVRSVGHGGEATLYLAEVSLAGQTEPVVVKVLNSEVTTDEQQFAELSARWGEQAELLRFINRLGVVGVREHFEGAPEHPADGAEEYTDRALYLVMNYVEGVDLRDWRAEHAVEGVRGQREVLRYLEQIAVVLEVLHSGRGTPSKRVVVHGDLSPGNIMISEEGQATLVDFGLSRIAARHLTARPWFTPGYAAPEIFSGEYTPATDRYAFGAIAWFALTGEEPPTTPEQLRERFGALPLLAGAGERQRELVMSMFSAEPGDRPESTDWVRALRTLATSVPWTGPTEDPTDDEDTEPSGAGPSGVALAGGVAGVAVVSGAAAGADPTGAEDAGTTEARAVPGWLDVDEPSKEGGSSPQDASASQGAAEGPRPTNGSGSRPGAESLASPSGPPVPGTPPRPVGGLRGRTSEQRQPAPPSGPPSPGPRTGPATPRSAPAGPPPVPPPGPNQGVPQPPPGGSRPVAPPGPQPAGYPGPAAAPPYGPTTGTFTRPVYAESPDTGKKGKRSRKPLLIGFAIVAVLFLVLGSGGTFYVLDRFGYVTFQAGGTDGVVAAEDPSPSPTRSADLESDETEPETEGPTEEPSGGPTEEAAPSNEETSLTQTDPVETSGNTWTAGRAEMDGEPYNSVLRAGDGCYSGCVTWAEYNLGRNWDTFTAVVGLDDNSRSAESVTFSVYVDGEVEWRETATLGETLESEVDVSDVLRLRLEVEVEDDDVFPIWADPTLFSG